MKKTSKGHVQNLRKLETKLMKKKAQLNEDILQLQQKVLKWRTKCNKLMDKKTLLKQALPLNPIFKTEKSSTNGKTNNNKT